MTTEAIFKTDLWLVVGNNNGWGKGSTLREALGNMLKAGGSYAPTEAWINRWDDVLDTERRHYYVDGIGSVCTPHGAPERSDLTIRDAAALKKLHSAYFGFTDAVDEFQYSPEMDEVFSP